MGPQQPKGNYDYVRKIMKQMIPSSPQIVEGTKLELRTIFSWRASRTQPGQNYVLHIIPKISYHEYNNMEGKKISQIS